MDQAYARLEAEAVEQRLAAQARLKFEGGGAMVGSADAAAEFDRTLQLLRERKRAPNGGTAHRTGRTPRVASNEEVRVALVKRLAAFGARVMEEEGQPAGDVPAKP